MRAKFLMKKDVSMKIELTLAKMGLTKRQFAQNIGVSHSYFIRVLRGKTKAGTLVATKIASGLKKDVDEIFLITVD
ncbi:helix-turn-helix transcriptional regulator [Halalkalibacterium halodurans]|uniref:helix-turn-helix transcriptional regulator n=1 Tax=Halalkalibacterium halodurans TaxID=86665 RepID=UPI001419F636|nr:helix-turn-helix transcriptional regulator [Halalkalibacterium halodurans]